MTVDELMAAIEEGDKHSNKRMLAEFTLYCEAHPEERFWQALRNWADVDMILAVKGYYNADTFHAANNRILQERLQGQCSAHSQTNPSQPQS
jgi:hypothetical protein